MYCSKCGRKLNKNDGICPECGIEAAEEYCGGFWGLVGNDANPVVQRPKQQVSPAAGDITALMKAEPEKAKDADPEVERAMRAAEKWENKYLLSRKFFCVVIAAILLFSLIQTINVSVKKSKIHKLESETITQEQFDTLQAEKEELESERDALKQQVQDYNATIRSLEKNGTYGQDSGRFEDADDSYVQDVQEE